jgi:hypothetical protein
MKFGLMLKLEISYNRVIIISLMDFGNGLAISVQIHYRVYSSLKDLFWTLGNNNNRSIIFI